MPKPNLMTFTKTVRVPIEIFVTMDMSTETVVSVEFEREHPVKELQAYAESNPEAFSPWMGAGS